jgi:membrane protease YdiL (CAAX protease family)
MRPPALHVRLLIAATAEVIFLFGPVPHLWAGGPVLKELELCVWRVPSIALYYFLFRDVIGDERSRRRLRWSPALTASLLICALSGSLLGHAVENEWPYKLTLAVTAPHPALREELFYRVCVFACLAHVLGPWVLILSSAMLFAAGHYGAFPLTVANVTYLVAVGFLLAAVYHQTRNLWIVFWMHTIIGFVPAVWPGYEYRAMFKESLPTVFFLSPLITIASDVIAVVCAAVWWRGHQHRQPIPRGVDRDG